MVYFQGMARIFCMMSDIPDGYDDDFPNRVIPAQDAQKKKSAAGPRVTIKADVEQAVAETFKGKFLSSGYLKLKFTRNNSKC